MIDLKQKKDGWCGPAALSFALLKQGKFFSQEEIARETGTTVTSGVDPAPLVTYVKSKGFTPIVKKNDNPSDTLRQLSVLVGKGRSVIVDYLEGNSYNDGHYVVFQGTLNGKVLLWNPETGKVEHIKKETFIQHWKDKTENGTVFKNWALIF